MSRMNESMTGLLKKAPPQEKAERVKLKFEKQGIKDPQATAQGYTYSNYSLLLEQLESNISTIVEVAEENVKAIPADSSARVKLLFVDIGQSYSAVNSILKITGNYPKFGRIHTGLAIGSKIVEWNNSSLCIPRDVSSGKAILAFDICTIPRDILRKKLKALSKLIEEWNVNVEYSALENNCQKFVVAALKSMDIEYEFTGLIKQYTDAVRDRGYCTREVILTKEIIDFIGEEFLGTLGVKKGKLSFESHEELDNFVIQVMNRTGDDFFYEEKTSEKLKEFRLLLKAFDRGFWLNNYRDYNVQAPTAHKDGCPFKDPNNTQTQWQPTNRISRFAEQSGQVVGGSATSGASGTSGAPPKGGVSTSEASQSEKKASGGGGCLVQ